MNDSDPSRDDQPTGQLEREAAKWCAVMQGPNADMERPAFEAWLKLGAFHRSAYNQAMEIYLLAPRFLGAGDDMPTAPPSRGKSGRLRTLTYAASAAAAVAAALAVAPPLVRRYVGQTPLIVRASYEVRTPTGAGQRLSLLDGSSVDLGPGSVLSVSMDTQRRMLGLARGRARVEVATDPRPLMIRAGHARIVPRGRIVEIAVVGTLMVTVHPISGSANVFPAGQATQLDDVVTVVEGQTVEIPTASETPSAGPAQAPQPRTVGELIAISNSMHPGGPRILLDDQKLADTILSGRFRVHSPPAVAAQLSSLLGRRIASEKEGLRLYSPRGKKNSIVRTP